VSVKPEAWERPAVSVKGEEVWVRPEASAMEEERRT
jgi:hypothetical protein